MATLIELAQMTDTMTEGTLVTWLKHEGDLVEIGDALAEIETDKAVMELETPHGGTVLKTFVAEGETIPCGTAVAAVGQPGEAIPDIPQAPESAPADDEAPQPAEAVERTAPTGDRIKASPVARKLAAQAGLALRDVSGTGPDGRIVKRDVEEALQAPASAEPAGRGVRLSTKRRVMIERLVSTHQSVPTFDATKRISMDAAISFREALKATEAFADGIGFTELLVMASALAMRAVPALNARYAGDRIDRLDEVHVGVAVGLDEAVVVPVIRSCQAKKLSDVADDFRRLTERARSGSLLADDFGNSTFTLSNLGMYGVDEFTAILNAPDAAILAAGAITEQPVVRDGQIVVGNILTVTLTVDHRVADGVQAAQWLAALARYMENPVSLLVEQAS